MERLTHKIVYDNEHCQYVFSYNQDSEVGTKLGELEDILEKYGIESVEELEDYLTPKLFCHAKLSENLDEFKKNYKCESIIHIDTCEPQIELITDKVKDLKQELAELKQKAIVLEKAFELACDPRDDWGGKKYSGTEFDNYHDYFIAEAEQKLAEIGGEDE